MKLFFEEPRLTLEQFTVVDQVTVSWVTGDPNKDETNAYGIAPIGPA